MHGSAAGGGGGNRSTGAANGTGGRIARVRSRSVSSTGDVGCGGAGSRAQQQQQQQQGSEQGTSGLAQSEAGVGRRNDNGDGGGFGGEGREESRGRQVDDDKTKEIGGKERRSADGDEVGKASSGQQGHPPQFMHEREENKQRQTQQQRPPQDEPARTTIPSAMSPTTATVTARAAASLLPASLKGDGSGGSKSTADANKDRPSAVARGGGGLATLAVAATISGGTFVPPGCGGTSGNNSSSRGGDADNQGRQLELAAGSGGRSRAEDDNLMPDTIRSATTSPVLLPGASGGNNGVSTSELAEAPLTASGGSVGAARGHGGTAECGGNAGKLIGLGMPQGGAAAVAAPRGEGRAEDGLSCRVGVEGRTLESGKRDALGRAPVVAGGKASTDSERREESERNSDGLAALPLDGQGGLGREELREAVGGVGADRELKRMRLG